MEETPHPTELNRAAFEHAKRMIAEGRISTATPWHAPSAELGDETIARDGINAYSIWFLGIHPGKSPETKEGYGFPISNDFTNVSLDGLRAADSRAGQWKHGEIETAARELYEAAKAAVGA